MKVVKRYIDFKNNFEIQVVKKKELFFIRSIYRNENKWDTYKDKFSDYEAALNFAQLEFARICY
jgi:hypothetical protein